ncbi:MAG: amino acid permease [Bifidobacteriaceae bacterium]|jgi:APA family basic amino acid/polyamine antiporter|nr:amino acid permease [Bifidobacteriaceae bacterium]
MNLTRKHSVDYTLKALKNDNSRKLKRTLDWRNIAIMSVAMCVGAGIFSVGARVISVYSGPSAIISFLIAGFVCLLAAMCYAEFSSVIPVTGSAYTYSYAALGEFMAWLIGWSVILEMFLAATVILKYWCVYLYDFFDLLGADLSPIHIGGNGSADSGLVFDWPIPILAFVLVFLLIRGTDISSMVANVLVVVKLIVIAVVVIMGLKYFDLANFKPFIPASVESVSDVSNVLHQSLFSFLLGLNPSNYGIIGIFSGASVIFFAFIGFDNAASLSEEAKDPRKNVPLGLIAGVLLVTGIYVTVAVITCGMVPYTAFAEWTATHPDSTPSLTTAFAIHGDNNIGAIIAFGIIIGLFSVILMCMLGFSRIVFAMSRDGLLPKSLSVTGKHDTPYRIQIIGGVLMTLVAAFAYADVLDEMISIGTLFAFIVVSYSVPVFRKNGEKKFREIEKKHPELIDEDATSGVKPFQVPFCPVFPIISGTVCLWLTMQLAVRTWLTFLIWMAIGLVIYFLYSYKHSELELHSEYIAD